jgi:hypothetical protein
MVYFLEIKCFGTGRFRLILRFEKNEEKNQFAWLLTI